MPRRSSAPTRCSMAGHCGMPRRSSAPTRCGRLADPALNCIQHMGVACLYASEELRAAYVLNAQSSAYDCACFFFA